jgi:hypothetical protein
MKIKHGTAERLPLRLQRRTFAKIYCKIFILYMMLTVHIALNDFFSVISTSDSSRFLLALRTMTKRFRSPNNCSNQSGQNHDLHQRKLREHTHGSNCVVFFLAQTCLKRIMRCRIFCPQTLSLKGNFKIV